MVGPYVYLGLAVICFGVPLAYYSTSTLGSGGSLGRGAFRWNLGCTPRVATIAPTYNGVELIEKKAVVTSINRAT